MCGVDFGLGFSLPFKIILLDRTMYLSSTTK